uniref:Reverse transcriptase domain-containing protein n=1 Tax=Tanacetum cinerariifolium TaxID=118510 RepID=A0A699GX34_TANCI|nr:reverse transcriptase domain-containing protein [Tanacetum cinerariifolium]
MHTRSSTRNRSQQQVTPNIEPFDLEEPIENPYPLVVTMADTRTMAQLLQAPTEGYEDAIVVLAITANNFELKHGLLTLNDQDSLNSVAGGNFLDKMPQYCLAIIESKSKVRYSRSKAIFAKVSTSTSTLGVSPDVAELKDMVKALLLDKKNESQAPATVKAVKESCVTCGGAHSYCNCPTTDGNVNRDNIQEYISQAAALVEHEPDVTKDMVQPSTKNIQLPMAQTQTQIDEPVVAPKAKPTIPYPSRINKEKLCEKDDLLALKFMDIFRNLHFKLSFVDALLHMPKFAPMFRKLLNNKDKIISLIKTPVNENCSAIILKKFPKKLRDPDPRVPLILERPFLRTTQALIDVHDEQMTLRRDDQSITFKVGDTKTFSYNIIESVNRVNVIDIACDFILEEIEACLSSNSIPPGIDDTDFDQEGDILLLEKLLNFDPLP